MRRTILYIALFGSGLGIGTFAEHEHARPPESGTEQEWQRLFNEEGSHERIVAFQHVLTDAGIANDLATFSKQLELQLRIEDLIVKSREAEYAKITPLSAIIVPLISAIAGGIITALVGGRMRRSTGFRSGARSLS